MWVESIGGIYDMWVEYIGGTYDMWVESIGGTYDMWVESIGGMYVPCEGGVSVRYINLLSLPSRSFRQ